MKAVQFMIDTANDNSHGYDQKHRNGPDYDCSSLVGTALHEAGFNVSPASWTGNLEQQLRNCGFVSCSAPWQAGDIHLKPHYHVCMSINPTQIAQASINEKGTVIGGKTGDQTGHEINIKNYYEYKGGWTFHLRYVGQNNDVMPGISVDTVAREVIAGKYGNGAERKNRLEQMGYNYSDVQRRVNELKSGKILKSDGEIARQVIAGKWGNGAVRKIRLTSAGYNYSNIRKLVNQMLS